jgi:PAS domain S-box-containing protein
LQEPQTSKVRDLDHRAFIDALARAVVAADVDGTILLWNREAEHLYGWREEEVLGRSILDVLVPVQGRDAGIGIIEGVRQGDSWDGDFTVQRRDGMPMRVRVTDRPVYDADGHVVAVIGISEDVAEQRLVEQVTADLSERLQLALEAGGLGTFQWDNASGTTRWDERVEALFGLEPGTFEGTFDAWTAMIHPDDRDAVLATVQEAVRTASGYTVDHRVVWPDGSIHWVHGAGHVTFGPDGEVTGAIGVTGDITDERRAREDLQRLTLEALEAADRERASAERLAFLGRINDALAAARDRPTLMQSVVRAAVPRLGDWCVIHVLPTDGTAIPDVELAHGDPEMAPSAQDLIDRFPYDPDAEHGVARVIRTGRPEFLRVISQADIESVELSEEEQRLFDRLEPRSAITVPLTKRGRVLGALQLVMAGSGRHYSPEDLALAEAAGARIASSLENLRLTDEQRHIALTLQASLLPAELPDVPDIDIAVRYWANGAGVEVGGDFYDVFEVSDGLWAFVIGDVCGTGPQAAATAGLIRHTIAAAAWHGDTPTKVLHSLNRTMRNRRAGPFCTVVYGTIDRTDAGPHLEVVCGGHPLPVLADRAGDAEPFGQPGTLIGALDRIEVNPTERVLRPGDTLVAYTDGATDLPPPHALTELDVARLVGKVAAASTSVDDVAEGLHHELDRILPIDERNDDVALLVIRAS